MTNNNQNKPFPSQLFIDILYLWQKRQIGLKQVLRWSRFSHSDDRWGKSLLNIESILRKICCFLRSAPVREQNCLQHTDSLSWLTNLVIGMIKESAPYLDYNLLAAVPALHDEGEDELKRDIAFIKKNNGHDLAEYKAFRSRYAGLEKASNSAFTHIHQAFLLQFCLEIPENFPKDARLIMSELAEKKQIEARLFNALEHIDYILFALEQYLTRGHAEILFKITNKSLPVVTDHAQHIPALEKHLWTKQVQDNFARFLKENHNSLWIE